MRAFAVRFGNGTSHIILSIITIIAAIILWKFIAKVFKKNKARIDKAENRTTTAFHITYNLIKYIIIVITVIIVLQFNGVNVSAMVTGLGLLSAIVGLALQDEIKDIIMGFHIMADGFFHVGDVVKYGDITGKVVSYSLKLIKIESIDDHSITTICNSNITEITLCSDVLNIDVPLSYDDDVKYISTCLQGICSTIATDEDVFSAEFKGTQNFNSSSISYRITLRCPPESKPDVRRRALRTIQDGLAQSGLYIPFDQLDVHTK